MECEESLPQSQVPVTCPYPEPARSISHTQIPLPQDPSYYYSYIYAWVSQVATLFRFPHQKPVYASPNPLHPTCPAYIIRPDLSREQYLVRGKHH